MTTCTCACFNNTQAKLKNVGDNCACMKGGEGLYEPARWQPSDTIEVDRFRQIFMLPLAFHRSEFDENDDLRVPTQRLLEALQDDSNDWQAVDDLSDHCDGQSMDHAGRAYASKINGRFWDKLNEENNKRPEDQRLSSVEIEDLAATQTADHVAKHEDEIKRFAALDEQTQAYGEQVYFHDFLRETFYAKVETGLSKEVNLFRRTHRHKICFSVEHWKTGNFAAEAQLDRINLYVFSSGAAILVMEADFGVSPMVRPNDAQTERPMTMADALVITDHLRRTYPPYFNVESDKKDLSLSIVPGRVAKKVHVKVEGDDGIFSTLGLPFGWNAENVGDFTVADNSLRQRGKTAPPVFDHIRALAAPMRIAGTPEADEASANTAPVMRQVVDERMPLMTFITFKGQGSDQDKVRQISRGDWMRLCYADEPGDDILPYSGPFMENFERDCCYDRNFPHPSNTDGTSRIMTCGYHFVVAGAGGFVNESIQHHFRRHYFQIGLACHMEIAAMLATSSRVTEAVKTLNDRNDSARARRRFEATMQAIERDFLKYVHIFHFTGMSNQIQPNEMLDKWQSQLATKVLFDDLKNEIDTANQFLVAVDQANDSNASMRLNIIATIGLVLGLAFAFLSMNILGAIPESTEDPMTAVLPLANPAHWRAFGVTLALFSAVGFVMSVLIDRDWFTPHNTRDLRVGGLVFWLGVAALLVGLSTHFGAPLFGQLNGIILIIGFICIVIGLVAFQGNGRAIKRSFCEMISGTTGTTRVALVLFIALGLLLATQSTSIALWFVDKG